MQAVELIDKIVWSDYLTNYLQKEILENIALYKNINLSQLDLDHEWVHVPELDRFYGQKMNSLVTFLVSSRIFYCLKTKDNALTYQYKDTILKPFKFTSHKWLLQSANGFSSNYQCSECNLSGSKPNNVKTKTIIPFEKGFMTCAERLIKNIIE